MNDGEDNWQPPTEAEMKVIRARQDRSSKISKLMSEYLLKGYKMLGTSCQVCNDHTILLRDKKDNDYCITCSELDEENIKDNPAFNYTAARTQVREAEGQPQAVASVIKEQEVHLVPDLGATALLPTSSTLNSPPMQRVFLPSDADTALPKQVTVCETEGLASPWGALQDKLQWATIELARSHSVEYSTQLCGLVKACADAMLALQQLRAGMR
ncbi:PREDICTED: Sjoegren syndrome/scleroderma autoantigen 1 homolog [Priapulus caudatus]|uniref:Sjoegren syndrome/scleroderma autoantigen 1 homolog n=1 Tax=Priapulus caudatus TaxID=37621 RepID=A0ABM1ERA1_PRICU|nr:PREDICTED: Sjoegren syndrome/scleroderma autoantigen 1 homolog [Priapulus caudatus]